MNYFYASVVRLLKIPVIARLPVRVRSGVAAGAAWSFFPWTSYWRGTHEPEAQKQIAKLWDWTGKMSGTWAVTMGFRRWAGPAGRAARFGGGVRTQSSQLFPTATPREAQPPVMGQVVSLRFE